MSKSWQAYALHILDVAARIERAQTSTQSDSVRAMLAAADNSSF